MINLETVKPGDILMYRGTLCKVKGVHLHRLEDMTTEVSGISVKFLEGKDKYSEPSICPGGFKNLEYIKKEAPWMYNGKNIKDMNLVETLGAIKDIAAKLAALGDENMNRVSAVAAIMEQGEKDGMDSDDVIQAVISFLEE